MTVKEQRSELVSKIEKLNRQIERLKNKKTFGEKEQELMNKKVLEKLSLENELAELQKTYEFGTY